MNFDKEIQELEELRDIHKEKLNLCKRLHRLMKNRDFKELILEQFMVQECARYARLSSNFSLSPEDRHDALGMAQAAGYLQRFFAKIEQQASVAESQVDGIEEELDELRRSI